MCTASSYAQSTGFHPTKHCPVFGVHFKALGQGLIDEALAQLFSLRPDPTEEPVQTLDDAISYLHNHRAWIGNYQAWTDLHYPVGSGMVEREVEIVINRRLKRQGMRWLRANADALVALRVRTINSTWTSQTTLVFRQVCFDGEVRRRILDA